MLWERTADLQAPFPNVRPEVAADVRWFEARIWTWSWYIQSKVLRGELYEALDGLQYVRDQVLFRLLAFHDERRPAGGRRAEAVVGDHGDAFARTVPKSLDPASVLAALRPRSTCIGGWRTRSSNGTGSKPPKRARSSSARLTSAWTGSRDRRETVGGMPREGTSP